MILQQCKSLLQGKGDAYSGQTDTLANFKRNGERLGLSKYQIWAVYCGKHIDAIFNSIKENPDFPIEKTETMDGRIVDAINYLLLLHGLQIEDMGGINDPYRVPHIDPGTAKAPDWRTEVTCVAE